MLEANGLRICYGAVPAVHDVTFKVQEGQIVSIIGANGAGKT
ncbi:ATP-binding cassette domain-containing protein, partial [Candidatus Aerophobetes bacterium]|nr:ATP-binding cassette domain-containing protein [Candidatus Aerophobetes bacterium]